MKNFPDKQAILSVKGAQPATRSPQPAALSPLPLSFRFSFFIDTPCSVLH